METQEMKHTIKVIAFDADDTLWSNEPFFQEVERKYTELLSEYGNAKEISVELFKTEMKNLHMYGYGLKSMMLSMIETACRITGGKENLHCAEEIIRLGQELLQKPVTLLDGVEDVLLQLQGKYKLVLATKGDLFDQKRKVMDSGLVRYFCHIEIMSDKKEADYQKLLNTVGCAPQNFLMLGNSIKSDILPILNLGGYAAHIPYHITWQYENHEGNVTHPNFLQLKNIKDIIGYLL